MALCVDRDVAYRGIPWHSLHISFPFDCRFRLRFPWDFRSRSLVCRASPGHFRRGIGEYSKADGVSIFRRFDQPTCVAQGKVRRLCL